MNQLEVSGNSLERVQQFVSIEQEARPTANGVPPAYWPASGHLKVEKPHNFTHAFDGTTANASSFCLSLYNVSFCVVRSHAGAEAGSSRSFGHTLASAT